jgi:hypothetical protein
MVSQKALDFLLFGKKSRFSSLGENTLILLKNTLKDDVDTIFIIIFRQIIINTFSE